jgi:hypothetical protein
MKTKILAILTLAIATLTQQDTIAQTVGLRAGVNFQNINGKDLLGNRLHNDMLTGFHAGLNVEIPVATDFYLRPGLIYSTKGSRQSIELEGDQVKTQLGYLELPVNFLYKPAMGPGNLLLGFGPYVARGITGKISGGSSSIDVNYKHNPEISLDPVYYEPWDAGMNLLFGYEFAGGVSAQLNAQWGLTNNNAYDNEGVYKHTGFGISLGYRF